MGQKATKAKGSVGYHERRERLLLLLPKYGFKIAAAGREAGYSDSYATHKLACVIKQDVEFCRRIEQSRAENLGLAEDKIAAADTKLQNLIDQGGLSHAHMLKALELFYRRHGALADKQIIETAERERELSQAAKAEARRLSIVLMREKTGSPTVGANKGEGVPKAG